MSPTRIYNISDCISFRKTTEEYGGLSNMAPGYSLKIHDVIIPTAEHIYQASRFPDYPDVQWSIVQESNPMKAKWIAYANLHLSRDDWDYVRFKVMAWALELKLSQNWEPFSNLLRSTEGKSIVEVTPKDKVWGAVKDGTSYIGVNALGRLLMNIRDKIVLTNEHNICVEPASIPNFQFLEQEIGLICQETELQDIQADLMYYPEVY